MTPPPSFDQASTGGAASPGGTTFDHSVDQRLTTSGQSSGQTSYPPLDLGAWEDQFDQLQQQFRIYVSDTISLPVRV